MALSRRFMVAGFQSVAAVVALAAGIATTTTHAQDPVFDEVRFGATLPVAEGMHQESGAFPSLTVFFDPLGANSASTLTDKILRPRIHAGTSVATSSNGVNQIYGGFSWDADLTERFFVELGVGATLHDGELDGDGSDGPRLGCRVLFREYAAAGYRFDANWNLSATIEHNSHANLCDGPNGGLTRAGLMLGYQF
ncbi:hypothetical protein J2Z31_005047 [Sinorhizobium kostiense]|uniref:Lipid A 3-O-deacylase PagL n=1 Tax=Sinorhizobium kostiense TaxID=76747 RepID=A0ABS4R6J0_9HYPH|nr:acyloxyacyl hydrolase [Sinorhizobium kostiense]MBP2238510.1 hypothetical protein [Sinorhizobium kostiense]